MSEFRVTLPARVSRIRAVLPKTLPFKPGPPEPEEPEPDQATVMAELEREYQARSEAAYKHGVEDGTAMGIEQGRQEVQGAMAQLEEMVQGLASYRESMVREVDEIVTQLSLTVAKMLIHREVTADADIIRQVVSEALKQVEDRRSLVIKVNPDDWQRVKGFEETIREVLHGLKELEIKEDAQIRQGGCLIESDSGIVDARIDTQVEEIAAGLLGGY